MATAPGGDVARLLDLPDGCWREVLSLLSVREVLQLVEAHRRLAKLPGLTCAIHCGRVSLEGRRLRRLLDAFPHARVVSAPLAGECPDDLFRLLGERLPGLKHLSLKGASVGAECSTRGLARCAKLRTLSVCGTLLLRDARWLAQSPRLEELMVRGGVALTDAHCLSAVAAAPSLRAVALVDCTSLPSLSFDHATLVALDLHRCASLRSLRVSLPRLRLLDVSDTAVDGDGLAAALRACPQLATLLCRGCRRLRAAELDHDALEVLDARLCPGLEACRVVAPRLRLLRLDCCMAVRELDLTLLEARRLDLSQMALRSLRIVAPRLEALNLNGCTMIRRAEMKLPALRSLFADEASAALLEAAARDVPHAAGARGAA